MIIIRPITRKDTEAFIDIAFQAGLGMTSMLKNRDFLSKRVEDSIASFETIVTAPSKEYYLFVLEDTSTQQIGGTCAIFAQTGRETPLFFFRIENREKHFDVKHTLKKIATLRGVQYRHYWSEIASLFLVKNYRKSGIGRLLSLSRFLFIAEHPKRFSKMLFAEMRGHIIDDISPFWEGIGAHFIETDFVTLMRLRAEEKVDLSQILPTHPIYIELLPKQVQECIAKVHQNAAPALQMLLNEGFKHSDEIDVCDGGPKLEAEVQDIRTIRESTLGTVSNIAKTPASSAKPLLLSTRTMNFRACQARVTLNNSQEIVIDQETAEALQVSVGDSLRYVHCE